MHLLLVRLTDFLSDCIVLLSEQKILARYPLEWASYTQLWAGTEPVAGELNGQVRHLFLQGSVSQFFLLSIVFLGESVASLVKKFMTKT